MTEVMPASLADREIERLSGIDMDIVLNRLFEKLVPLLDPLGTLEARRLSEEIAEIVKDAYKLGVLETGEAIGENLDANLLGYVTEAIQKYIDEREQEGDRE